MGNPDFLKMGAPQKKGRKELDKYLAGKAQGRAPAIRAKCYECMGGYADGAADCLLPKCPLYGYMPYRAAESPRHNDPCYKEPGKTAKGRMEFIAHMQGGTLTRKDAILAKCYDCMGGYVDGKCRCKIPSCPLHPWMPYKDNLCPHEKEK